MSKGRVEEPVASRRNPDSAADSSQRTVGVDARGTLCPVPILLTTRASHGLEEGATIEGVGDDPRILEDVPVWCDETGHRLIHLEEAEGQIRWTIEIVG